MVDVADAADLGSGVLVVSVPSGGVWRGYLAASGYWAAVSTKPFTLA